MIHLPNKILNLRKQQGMSQEELAEKIGVSRQAVSRWEGGTAVPDAANLVQLSNLFGVTTDYLLYDDCQGTAAAPKPRQGREGGADMIMICLIALEAMVLAVQFVAVVILQNAFFGILSILLFAAVIGGFAFGFERAYRKRESAAAAAFRRRFYQISVWLGAYFPVRLLTAAVMRLSARPDSAVAFESVVAAVYLTVSAAATLFLGKRLRH